MNWRDIPYFPPHCRHQSPDDLIDCIHHSGVWCYFHECTCREVLECKFSSTDVVCISTIVDSSGQSFLEF